MLLAWLILLGALAQPAAAADKRYGPGVSDTEIKIGQTMPYSGPVSAFATMGKAELAYFKMINEQGGVNRRKINLISLDDGYSPPRTVEQTRKLIEAEQVLLLFSSFGAPTNTSVLKYAASKKVPQLFIAATGLKWGDPKALPWTMSVFPSQATGTKGFVRHMFQSNPAPKIGVLYANDDFGKEYLSALRAHLGERAARLVVAEQAYESTDPTVDTQIVALKGSGADVFFNFGSPKFAAQAIRKARDIGWNPLQFIAYSATSLTGVLQPAGLDKSVGIVSAAYLKDPADPQWKDDPAVQAWFAWMKRYYPEGSLAEIYNVFGYTAAQALVHVLKQCGDDLTRENVMRKAGALDNLQLPLLLPGIAFRTSATDYDPVKQMQLMRFDGKQWVLFGEIVD